MAFSEYEFNLLEEKDKILFLEEWINNHINMTPVFVEADITTNLKESVAEAIRQEALKKELAAMFAENKKKLRKERIEEQNNLSNKSKNIPQSTPVFVHDKNGNNITSSPPKIKQQETLSEEILKILKSKNKDELRQYIVKDSDKQLYVFRESITSVLESNVTDSEYWNLFEVLMEINPSMFILKFIENGRVAIKETPEQTMLCLEKITNTLLQDENKLQHAYGFAQLYKDYLNEKTKKTLFENIKFLKNIDVLEKELERLEIKEQDLINLLFEIDKPYSVFLLYKEIKKALSNSSKYDILTDLIKIQTIIDRLEGGSYAYKVISDLIKFDCFGLSPKYTTEPVIKGIIQNGFENLERLIARNRTREQKETAIALVGKIVKCSLVRADLPNHFLLQYNNILGLLPKQYCKKKEIEPGEKIEAEVLKVFPRNKVLLLSSTHQKISDVESIPLIEDREIIVVEFKIISGVLNAYPVGMTSLMKVKVINTLGNFNFKKKYEAKIVERVNLFEYKVRLIRQKI